MHLCTCSTPPTIDIDDDACSSDLMDTFRTHGWCRIIATMRSIDDDHHSSFQNVKHDGIQMFEQENINHFTSNNITYRGRESESGSKENAVAEPKQSLEVKRRRGTHNPTDDFSSEDDHNIDAIRRTYDKLMNWCRGCHHVAKRVNRLLGIPDNTLLGDDDENCIDLLRVFLYDPVPSSSSSVSSPTISFGSSQHTDWGSWTVVWQDDVGGLQTFCHACNKWVHVPALASSIDGDDDGRLAFVVHMGDVASLAFGMTTREIRDDKRDQTVSQSGGEVTYSSAAESAKPLFPSPLHRVVSPEDQFRLSLVYFSYPPPNLSLMDIIEKLRKSCGESVLSDEPPYEMDMDSYYLLKNQNPAGEEEDLSADTTLRRIKTMSMKQVFEEKWSQVQRGY